MPRTARLDAPGVLHHVMGRGLDRQVIFRDDADREDFVRRLAGLAETGALTIYAWALLPNHLRLLLRTGQRPLARCMRSLLGKCPCPWQATGAVLRQFGSTPAQARTAYRAFVAAGIARGRRPDLQGGGLIRSLGGGRAVAGLRRGREAYRGDERVLGRADFVEAVRANTGG
jgi:REP element-mobilizing transposase RayT